MRLVQGDNGLSVETLKRTDIAILAERAWKVQRGALVESVRDAGMTPQEALAAFQESDLRRGSTVPLSLWLLSVDGMLAVVEAACAKSKVDYAKFVGELTIPELADITREIVWMMTGRNEQQGEPKAEPNGQ